MGLGDDKRKRRKRRRRLGDKEKDEKEFSGYMAAAFNGVKPKKIKIKRRRR